MRQITDLKESATTDRAVSPVIGVILMVAITVILAAVIGAFVLDLGSGLEENAPQASFDFEYDTDAGNVEIIHVSGDQIDKDRLSISRSDGTGSLGDGVGSVDDPVTSGSTIYNAGFTNGETIRVIWESASGDTSSVIAESTAPS